MCEALRTWVCNKCSINITAIVILSRLFRFFVQVIKERNAYHRKFGKYKGAEKVLSLTEILTSFLSDN